MKKALAAFLAAGMICSGGLALAASQDSYQLPEPYLGWEKQYLQSSPDLQNLMDVMTANSNAMLKKPDQDILHNRVCAAIAAKMAKDRQGSPELARLGPATDILHNIAKDNKALVLSKPEVLAAVGELVADLKKNGKFTKSPEFFTDVEILKLPAVSDNLGLVHHLTGAVEAGKILRQAGGFTEDEIRAIQAAIMAHSTGYWYFRESVDKAAGKEGAWKAVFPQPESDIDNFAHDADLISQFVPESVTPDGAKWRNLAKKRWGATNPQEEGLVVYYVFDNLYNEARTEDGKQMAKEKWDIIRPELMKLMGLKEGQDPVKVLGVPKYWQK